MTDHATLPLVSVIIPCFNQGQFLQESVQSAIASYSGPIEIVVVDDGSTEQSTKRHLDEAAEMAPYVRVVRKPNGGLSSARNAGFAASRGEFIQYLDADDLLVSPKIDAQVSHLRLRGDLDVSICDFLLCDEGRNNFWKTSDSIGTFALSREDFLYRWERGMSIPIHCALFRRSVISVSSFPEQLHAKEDWVFWTRLSLSGATMEYLPLHLTVYRQHGSSMRRSFVRMAKSWVQATLEIDKIAAGTDPTFFDASIEWLNRFYRSQAEYREELEGRQGSVAESQTPAVEVPQEEVHALLANAAASHPTGDGGPFFSVLVPVYNHYPHLVECLRSVFAQNVGSFELVCVNDCSSDPRVAELLDAVARVNPRVRVLHLPENRGISVAQNVGVSAAVGEYVTFLDCDDALPDGCLELIEKELRQRPSVDYLFTDRIDVDANGAVLRVSTYGGYENIRPSGDIAADLLDGMVASHLKVIRRAAYIECGGCDATITGVQDWDLALRLSAKGRFHYVDKPLYRHRIHAGSVTSSARVAQFRKTNIVRRRHQERLFCRPSLPPVLPLDGGRVLRQDWLSVFTAEDFRAGTNLLLTRLKEDWTAGKCCVAVLDGDRPNRSTDFLREFNSYFDWVLYDSPATCAALIGYLWSGEILKPTFGPSSDSVVRPPTPYGRAMAIGRLGQG